MNQSPHRFTFKLADESQRDLIHEWLRQDYISRWIHGQGLQNTLNGLEKLLRHRAENKPLDRTSTITHHWIGYDGDKPFVFLMTSNIFKNDGNEYTKYSETDGPFITLDIFICDTQYLGKGMATTIIKEFLSGHFSDVTEVFIDPEKSNERAIHVYQNDWTRYNKKAAGKHTHKQN